MNDRSQMRFCKKNNFKKEKLMKTEDLRKVFVTLVLAALIAAPAMAGAQDAKKPKFIETSKTTLAASIVDYEVIQVLRKADTDIAVINISGQPGDHYRIYYNATGINDSYAVAPNSQGVIGDNGIGTITMELGKLGKEQVFLKASISDTADFKRARTMPLPLVLDVEWVQIKQRGTADRSNDRQKEWRSKFITR
jgi:hypothetical protein